MQPQIYGDYEKLSVTSLKFQIIHDLLYQYFDMIRYIY